jgi:hypothetical protein
MAKATVVTPDPMRVSGMGCSREKTNGTATTTHPSNAMSNEMSRGGLVLVAVTMVVPFPLQETANPRGVLGPGGSVWECGGRTFRRPSVK